MTERTLGERHANTRYFWELGIALAAYGAVLLAVLLLVDFDASGPWKFAAAALPLIPVAAMVVAIARHFGRVDEMQRDIQLSGMAVGFAVACGSAVSLGFMSIAGLDSDPWGPWAIFSLAMLGWIIGSARRTRRLA